MSSDVKRWCIPGEIEEAIREHARTCGSEPQRSILRQRIEKLRAEVEAERDALEATVVRVKALLVRHGEYNALYDFASDLDAALAAPSAPTRAAKHGGTDAPK